MDMSGLNSLMNWRLQNEARDRAAAAQMREIQMEGARRQLATEGSGSVDRSEGANPMARLQQAAASQTDPNSTTPRSLGRFQMDQQGNWGTFVDPADIPAGLQDKIMGGQYGSPGNWNMSNPSIAGPQQWGTGKYTHQGGVNFPPSSRPSLQEIAAASPDPGEEFRRRQLGLAAQTSDREYAARQAAQQGYRG
jgi:hypothetical protein